MTAHPHYLIQQVFGRGVARRQQTYPIFVKGRRIMILNRRGKVRRSGRKPKANVVRDGTGKSRGETVESIMAVALAQPHRAALPEKYRHDALAGHPLGWLKLKGKITPAEYQAGQRYAEIVSRYRAAIGAPNPDTQIRPAGAEEMSRDEYRRRKAAYDAAFECIGVHRLQVEVARVAVHQRPWVDFLALQDGLRLLAHHFGLTQAREYANGEIRC